MMICCGVAVKKIGMLGVSVSKVKTLTDDADSDTDRYREIQSDMLCVLSV
jgi:hypothetical protein